jgi:hypothetical protein
VRVSRSESNDENLVATHRDTTASCTLLKFALLSVGDTYSVPFGHPVRGEEDASFCNWHARYSEERAWACKPRLAETAKRTARRIKSIDSDALPIGGSMDHVCLPSLMLR